MKKIITVTLFIFIVLTALASAQEEISLENLDINPITPELESDPCEEVSFYYDLTNIGAFQDTFDLGADPFGEYATFNMNPVTLLPGETKRIILTTTADCDVHGDIDIYFLAQSRWSGELFESKNTLSILPTNIPVIAKGVKKIKVDFGKSYAELPIENLGGKETTYLLSIEGDGWVSIEPSTLTVPARAEEIFRILTAVSNRTKQDTYPAVIVAKVADTGIEYAKNIKIQVKSPTLIDDLFSIYLYFTIGGIILIIIILTAILKIRRWWKNNKEGRAEKKRLKLEEKELRKMEKEENKQLKLQEKITKKKEKELAKRAKLQLKADKKREKSEAKYEILKEKVRSILLKTFNKEYKLIPREQKKSKKDVAWIILILAIIALVALGIIFRTQLQKYILYFILGIAIAVALCLGVGLLIHLRRKRAINKLNKKDYNKLYDSVKDELSLTYNLVSKEALRKFKGKKKWLKPVIAIIILAAIARASFALQKAISNFPAMVVAEVAGALIVFILLVIAWKAKTKRARCKEVELGTLQANKSETVEVNWKKGLGEFMFRIRNKAESVLLSVKLWKKNPVFLNPKEKVYQYFEVKKINIEDKNIDKVSFRFKVKKSWLKRNKIAPDKVSLIRYAANRWVKPQKLDIINETAKFIFYEATHASFSHFAIVGKEMTLKLPSYDREIKQLEKAKEKKTKKVRTASSFSLPTIGINRTAVGYILIAIAVILAGIFVFPFLSSTATVTPTSDLNEIGKEIEELTKEIAGIEAATGGIPSQIWYENQPWKVELGKYFSDPDGDKLMYSNSPVNHLTITYEGSTAFITPNPNWAGEEVVVFTATDVKGSSVDSNPLSLVVSPRKEKTYNFFSSYGWNILLGIILVIILVVAVEARKRIYN